MAQDPAAPSAANLRPGSRPFTLAPFRGLRFDPATVGDLSTVISPPYDVLDADTVRTLENANRRNIVRLILSRRFHPPYVAVGERLEKWRARSYLRADDPLTLYLYEYTAEGATVRGLIGLVGLRPEHERVILPHEDVMAGPVDDRAMLMRTTRTNLEPILLSHRGTDRLRELLAAVAAEPPETDVVALDGSAHRLWTIVDPHVQETVAHELAGTQALIADGHHRYAAYLRLQDEMREPDASPGASPWDHGLAMLVDEEDAPLRVGPIHRSIAALTLSDLRDLADDHDHELTTCADRESAFGALASADPADADRASFVVSDGLAWAVLRVPRTHEVDAAVLHERLMPEWCIAEEQVGYHHSLDQALRATTRAVGLVVAVRPPTVAEVRATAARGERMPRKSTSFGPKPRMGVVMRDLRDG
jgi:uncharacterized protein (DUF1015 family)